MSDVFKILKQTAEHFKKAESPYYVGLVVFNQDLNKILLGCRKEDGIWTGPGGGADMGELPKEAALRELWEEAGIKASHIQLEDLPTLDAKKDKKCHCFMLQINDAQEASVHLDPDEEVDAWGWYSVNQPLPEPMDKNRKQNVLNAIASINGIQKSMEGVSTEHLKDMIKEHERLVARLKSKTKKDDAKELSIQEKELAEYKQELNRRMSKAMAINEELEGVDLDTNDYSIDEMASKDNPMIGRIDEMMKEAEYGSAPRELDVNDNYKLILYRADDGVYSGHVKDVETGEMRFKINKMNTPNIVQALKAKGYLELNGSDSDPNNVAERVKEIVEDHEEQWEDQDGTPEEQAADAAAFEQIEELVNPEIHEENEELEMDEGMEREELSEILDALQGRPGDIHIHFHKAVDELYLKSLGEYFEKAQKLPIGTVRDHGGEDYQKVAEGKWVKVTNPRKRQQEDEERAHNRQKELVELKNGQKEESSKDSKKPEKDEPEADPMDAPGEGKVESKKVDNNLTPPPEENERFNKKDSEVTMEDVTAFIQAFEKDYEGIVNTLNSLKKAGATHVAARLKDENSLLKKMQTRKKDATLNEMSDVIGTRTLSESLEDQQNVLESVKKQFDIVEVQDDVEKAREGGYRAIHVLFKTESGKVAELQIKTKNQQLFSGFTHDNIYKGDEEVKNSPEVNKFTEDLSEYLYEIDKGKREDKPEDRPKEPQILIDRGITFNWNNLKKKAGDIPS